MTEDIIDLILNNYFQGSEVDIENQIVNKINQKCGLQSDIKDLRNLKNNIDEALESDCVKKSEEKFKNSDKLLLNIAKELHEIKEVLVKYEEQSKKVKSQSVEVISEKQSKYENLIKVEQLSETMSSVRCSIIIGDLCVATEELSKFINQVIVNDIYKTLDCTLMDQMYDSYHRINEELTTKFNTCLKKINWPFITDGLEKCATGINSELIEEYSEEMNILFNQMLKIELPKQLIREKDYRNFIISVNNSQVKSANGTLPSPPIIVWPVQLLLKQLVKYFIFYFCKSSKVNKINKPEYYTNQILVWVTVHVPVLRELFRTEFNVALEFMRGLVLLVSNKIRHDIQLIVEKMSDESNAIAVNATAGSTGTGSIKDDLEVIFFHLIEETLTLNIELSNGFEYPNVTQLPHVVDVLLWTEFVDCTKHSRRLSNEVEVDIGSGVTAEENVGVVNVFEYWMSVERKFALCQMDELFLSSTLWRPISSITIRVECLIRFTNIINAMKERIGCMNSIGDMDASSNTNYTGSNGEKVAEKMWCLCEVLLLVLSDFRMRLVQVSKQDHILEERVANVMNVLHGIIVLMTRWRLDPVFITIYRHLAQTRSVEFMNQFKDTMENNVISSSSAVSNSTRDTNEHIGNCGRDRYFKLVQSKLFGDSGVNMNGTDGSLNSGGDGGSVFDTLLKMYRDSLNVLRESCCQTIYKDVAERLRGYCHSTTGFPRRGGVSILPTVVTTVSKTATEALLMLRDRLHTLHERLEPANFRPICQGIASRLNMFLLNRVILPHRFTDQAAIQLKHDVSANFVTVFAPHISSPKTLFLESMEACTLLTISWGSAVLLRDLLQQSLSDGDQIKTGTSTIPTSAISPIMALKDVGVISIDPDMAFSILKLRVDPNLK